MDLVKKCTTSRCFLSTVALAMLAMSAQATPLVLNGVALLDGVTLTEGIAGGLHRVVPAGLQTWTASIPLWMRLAAALVVGEFGFYWGHRWTHEIPFLWRFHAIHHSAEELTGW
jgi:sterol desaturase/sphingolipid hydroxylase (fatty acid hydroxylase superfamily)